jgi:hypothetical protein
MGTMRELIEEAGKPQDDDVTLIRNVKARGSKAVSAMDAALKAAAALSRSLGMELPRFAQFQGFTCAHEFSNLFAIGGKNKGGVQLSLAFEAKDEPSPKVLKLIEGYVRESVPNTPIEVKKAPFGFEVNVELGRVDIL